MTHSAIVDLLMSWLISASIKILVLVHMCSQFETCMRSYLVVIGLNPTLLICAVGKIRGGINMTVHQRRH